MSITKEAPREMQNAKGFPADVNQVLRPLMEGQCHSPGRCIQQPPPGRCVAPSCRRQVPEGKHGTK